MGLTRQPLTPQQSYSPEIEPASDFTAFTGSPLTQSLASLQSALGNAGMLAWLNETAQAPSTVTPPPAGPTISDEDEDEGPLPSYQPPRGEQEETTPWARLSARFGGLDLDDDGTISDKELAQAVRSQDWHGEDAAAVGALWRSRSAVESMSDDEWFWDNDGVTKADLEALVGGAKKNNEIARAEYAFGKGRNRLAAQSDELFAHDLPRAGSVTQGEIGDCQFMAGLISKTYQDPAAMKDRIIDHKDGTYTVDLPGEGPVQVTRPSEPEMAIYASSGQDGFWATLVEKATAEAANRRLAVPELVPQEALDIAQMSKFFDLDDAIEALVGGIDRADLNKANFAGPNPEVTAGRDHQRSMVWEIDGLHLGERVEGLPDEHAYAVLRPTDDGKGVILRNPTGEGVMDPDRALKSGDRRLVRDAQGQPTVSTSPDSGDETSEESIGTGFFRLSWEEFSRIGDVLVTEKPMTPSQDQAQ